MFIEIRIADMLALTTQNTQPVQINIPDVRSFYLEGFTLILSSFLGIIIWFLKREMQRFTEAQAEMREQIKIQATSIIELEKSDLKTFATRDEMVRNVSVLEAKLDSMHRRIDEIKTILMRADR
jgi:polyhydroxyalkanoate synthesis regulator protein